MKIKRRKETGNRGMQKQRKETNLVKKQNAEEQGRLEGCKERQKKGRKDTLL
jgi:hypothetical protein